MNKKAIIGTVVSFTCLASAAIVLISKQTTIKVVAQNGPLAIDVNTTPPSGTPSVKLTTFRSGLSTPWGMAFLPDGRLLVTQKGGSLVLLSANGSTSTNISGAPSVDSSGQGGLLDVALDPNFSSNGLIYLSFSEAGSGGNGTAVARAQLSGSTLQNVTVIFRQAKKSGTSNHYGSRLLFKKDGTLLVTLGERFNFRDEAQSLNSFLGKVVRINTDGTPVNSNPFFNQGGNAAYIWTYGHRNPQGATLHPTTDELWIAEHGPQGGDEINLALPGRNFGWTNVSYGCDYGQPVGSACRIGGGTHNNPYTSPLVYWYPTSTAPGGIAIYNGDKFPEWQGNVFVGALAGTTLWRFVMDGTNVVSYQAFFRGQHEIRQITQGPDGYLYIISRSSNTIYRIERN